MESGCSEEVRSSWPTKHGIPNPDELQASNHSLQNSDLRHTTTTSEPYCPSTSLTMSCNECGCVVSQHGRTPSRCPFLDFYPQPLSFHGPERRSTSLSLLPLRLIHCDLYTLSLPSLLHQHIAKDKTSHITPALQSQCLPTTSASTARSPL